jgi:hypothetical protein
MECRKRSVRLPDVPQHRRLADEVRRRSRLPEGPPARGRPVHGLLPKWFQRRQFLRLPRPGPHADQHENACDLSDCAACHPTEKSLAVVPLTVIPPAILTRNPCLPGSIRRAVFPPFRPARAVPEEQWAPPSVASNRLTYRVRCVLPPPGEERLAVQRPEKLDRSPAPHRPDALNPAAPGAAQPCEFEDRGRLRATVPIRTFRNESGGRG